MTPHSDPPYELEVSRADLAQALKTIVRTIGKRLGDASLRFENGCLSIEAANTMAETPARGIWPVPIFVGYSWVRSGAPDNVVRTVTENCGTLKFETSGFEES